MNIRLKMLAVVISSFCISSMKADLIVNGSFEAPAVPVGGESTFSGGPSAINGWLVDAAEVSVVSGAFSSGCCTFPAEDGTQWLDIGGGVEQAVATTPGDQYTLSFWVGNVSDPNGVFGTKSFISLEVASATAEISMGLFLNDTPSTTLNWEQF